VVPHKIQKGPDIPKRPNNFSHLFSHDNDTPHINEARK
jgi:hypothetical protein